MSIILEHIIFAEILTQRPIKTGIKVKKKLSAKDLDYMAQQAKDHFDKIMEALRSMPKPMLLVIR